MDDELVTGTAAIRPKELVFEERKFFDSSTPPHLMCTECGCMVGDTEQHSAFLHSARPIRIVPK